MSRTSRTRALWSGAVTVALLAVVLIVAGLFGPLRGKSPSSRIPATADPQIAGSQSLYQQALQAQASGDPARAASLAQSALDANPDNAEARVLLDQAKKAVESATATTTPIGSKPTNPGVDANAAFLKRYEDLATLLPTAQAGFSFDYPLQSNRDISVSGNRVPGVRSIRQITWWVHDLKTRSAAKAFVTKTSKVAFPRDAAAVTVHGMKTYFGTDGTGFATIAFARGRYAFEVLVTVDGVAPKTAKSTASKAAAAFPESPTR